jgi:hypothetical protein
MSAKTKTTKAVVKVASTTGSRSGLTPPVDLEATSRLNEELALERQERNYFQLERVIFFR